MLASSAVDGGFQPWSGQAKDYTIDICCFSANHSVLRTWLARNWYNVSVCGSLCNKVCQWIEASWWFSPIAPNSATNKTHYLDIAEKIFKAASKTITLTLTIFSLNKLRIKHSIRTYKIAYIDHENKSITPQQKYH